MLDYVARQTAAYMESMPKQIRKKVVNSLPV